MRFLLLVLVVFIFSFTIFFPAINLHFASDDFSVIKKLCVDNIFWTEGFFRPIGDLLLLLDYEIAGFNASYFHITNIIIHSINTCLVYYLCQSMPIENRVVKTKFSYLATILFLTYPFHLESVLWIVSRSSALGAMFGILTLTAYFKLQNRPYIFLVVVALYSLGLMCFENIFFIPLIILVFEFFYFRNKRNLMPWIFVFTASLIIHLFLRLLFSGAIWGDYGGQQLFSSSFIIYFQKALKAFGRLFLPPSDNDKLMTLVFAVSVLFLFIVLFLVFRSRRLDSSFKKMILCLGLALLISMIIPSLFGISTRTSEGDRLLYFPSVFFIAFVSLLIIELIKSAIVKRLLIIILFCYQLFFLFQIQNNWLKASKKILQVKACLEREKNNRIVFINVPGEYEGAYIFRNGLYDAPFIWGGHKKEINIVNVINKKESLNFKFPMEIKYVTDNDELNSSSSSLFINKNSKTIYFLGNQIVVDKNQSVLYWNGVHIKELTLF